MSKCDVLADHDNNILPKKVIITWKLLFDIIINQYYLS